VKNCPFAGNADATGEIARFIGEIAFFHSVLLFFSLGPTCVSPLRKQYRRILDPNRCSSNAAGAATKVLSAQGKLAFAVQRDLAPFLIFLPRQEGID
jgi:hypothetical protein